jgi:hypothetical protein
MISAIPPGTLESEEGRGRPAHSTNSLRDPIEFEHEWKVEPRPGLPSGENAVIRWELRPDGAGMRLRLTHRNLGRPTALGLAPAPTRSWIDWSPDWVSSLAQLARALHVGSAPVPLFLADEMNLRVSEASVGLELRSSRSRKGHPSTTIAESSPRNVRALSTTATLIRSRLTDTSTKPLSTGATT